MNYPAQDRAGVIKFLREAADVQRCHTIRTLGEYSVGHHSFNMLAMLRILWPDAPKELIWAIIEHDVPERLTGDIPAPSKWQGIVDRDGLSEFESLLKRHLMGHDFEGRLEEPELAWLRGLDILELWMFAKDQHSLGNTNFLSMIYRIDFYIQKNPQKFAPQVVDLYYEMRRKTWNRMPELGDESLFDVDTIHFREVEYDFSE